ncbi:hypothetical protein DL93DRAFT_616705 [Clavulina sp. PMI_390]|nr:hypothetical protein DL93DRAFT_616705 [Clavulina sp. PMI_390]
MRFGNVRSFRPGASAQRGSLACLLIPYFAVRVYTAASNNVPMSVARRTRPDWRLGRSRGTLAMYTLMTVSEVIDSHFGTHNHDGCAGCAQEINNIWTEK